MHSTNTCVTVGGRLRALRAAARARAGRWRWRARRPILWITGGLLCGQVLGARDGAVVIAAAAVALALLCLCGCRRAGVVLVAGWLAVAVGVLQVDRLLWPELPADHVARFAGAGAEIAGWLVERAARAPRRTRLVVEVERVRTGATWMAASGRVLVTVRNAERRWRRGDRLRGRVRLRRPHNFGNPGEFDYVSYLARRGIYVTAFAASDRSWARCSAPGRGPLRLLDRWAEAVAAVLDQTLDGPARQIVAALVIGDRSGVSAGVSRRYARAGLSHVLSISGLHVGLVAGGAYVACRWLLARSEWLLLRANVPKLCAGFMTIPALAYAGMAGFSVPTVRSVVMLLLVGAGVLLDRQRDWLASLAGAALGISVLWPGSVFDISFQLSFASVLTIVLGMQRVTRAWAAWEERHLIRLRGRAWRLLRWGVGYCSVTLCATIGTAPLAAWHFNMVSLVSLIANPVVVPVLGLVTVATGLLAALVLPLSSRLAAVLFAAVGGIVELADALVAHLAALPGAAIHVVTPSLVELALIYGLLVAMFVISSPASRRLLVAVCVLGLAADGLYWCVERWHGADLRISFLSVGQGDSTVIEFPGAAVMVVDGGAVWGGFDIGERCIAPYLWRRKIAHVDALVLTHAQSDHYGGLGFLARTFAPDALWWNGIPGSGPSFGAFRSVVESEGVPELVVRRGYHRVIGGVDVRVLSPGESGAASLNDSSVTLRLQYGSTTVLLPGDIEADGERRLVMVEREQLRSAILKVPHHGSRTSSTSPFLDAVAPSWAVISAGYENRFGLPHRETLEAYRARGAHVWRTDVHGAVIVRVGKDGAVRIDSTREPNYSETRR